MACDYVYAMFQKPTLPPLRKARIHEVQGPGALAFALFRASAESGAGPIVFLFPERRSEQLLPSGIQGFVAPDRVVEVRTTSERDHLWALEEILRSGAAGFVIAVTERALSLTEGRRFQLAAEAGRVTGLLLTNEDAGCNAAETRWHCAPIWGRAHLDPKGDSTLAEWSITKNKSGTCESLQVRIASKTGNVSMVSPTGERPLGAAPAALSGGSSGRG